MEPGRHRGGDGVVREIEVLATDATVTLITERRSRGPWGVAGGGDGEPGRNVIDGDAVAGEGDARASRRGDRRAIETPGGGGWGEPG